MDWFPGVLWTILTSPIGYVVEVATFTLFAARLRTKETREEIIEWLGSKRGTRLYERYVGGALKRLTRSLTPENVEDRPMPKTGWSDRLDHATEFLAPNRAAAESAAASAFGWPVFDLAMRLAVLYPLFFLFSVWALTGEAGRLGEFVVLPPLDPGWPLVATRCGLAVIAALMLSSFYYSATGRQGYAVVCRWLAVAVAFAFAVAVAGAFAVAVTFAVAFAFAVAGAVAFAVAVAGAVAGAFAFAVAGAGAVAFAFAFAVAGAVAFAVAVAGAVAGAFAFAVAGAGAVTFAVAVAVAALLRKAPNGPLIYIGAL